MLKPAMGAPLRHRLVPQLLKPKIRVGVGLERAFSFLMASGVSLCANLL